MSETIDGLPFWQLTFDEQGETDGQATDTFMAEVQAQQVTDLVLFSHGWNNNQDVAMALYQGWFGQLAPQLQYAVTDRRVSVGLVGIFWPSQRWSDEPIPDFAAAPAAATFEGDAAAIPDRTDTVAVVTPDLDQATLETLKGAFPAGSAQLDRMSQLLAATPTDEAVTEFMQQLQQFATATSVGHDDGESAGDVPAGAPRMLQDDPRDLFGRYCAALRDSGVALAAQGQGEASIGDSFKGIWNGAKEALRQLTYWQMKNRAGVVGQAGLGPLLGRLHSAAPDVRFHLVGHSFGARVVSYALAGLPEGLEPSPVKAVTLLQGAFSHFAFADALPVDTARKGALAGMLTRIDGPLAVCFSSHDGAVGRFYPLASIAAGDDTSAAEDRFYRWGGMGHDGAQGVDAAVDSLRGSGPAVSYPFADGQALNIDASDVVCHGNSPAGAHSDIVHPELTWVVLTAGRIAT
jgi:hypothetical protein